MLSSSLLSVNVTSFKVNVYVTKASAEHFSSQWKWSHWSKHGIHGAAIYENTNVNTEINRTAPPCFLNTILTLVTERSKWNSTSDENMYQISLLSKTL